MKKMIIASLVAITTIGVALFALPAYAASCGDGTAAGEAMCGVSQIDTSNTNSDTVYDTVKTIINVLLFIVGIIAVIMIIWGGISYVLSAGAADKAKKARDTIVYSVVGLVVAIIAFAIVQFVFSSLGGGNSGGSGSPSQYTNATSCTNAGHTWDAQARRCR